MLSTAIAHLRVACAISEFAIPKIQFTAIILLFSFLLSPVPNYTTLNDYAVKMKTKKKKYDSKLNSFIINLISKITHATHNYASRSIILQFFFQLGIHAKHFF